MRVGIIRDWDAKWYAEKEYADYLHEDLAIHQIHSKRTRNASVSTIEIERAVNKGLPVSLHTTKPGMVIGKGGSNVDALRAQLNKLTGKQIFINIVEIRNLIWMLTLLVKQLLANLVTCCFPSLHKNKLIQHAMRAGAKEIKTQVSGRLDGADITHYEGYSEGTVPTSHTSLLISITLGKKLTQHGKLGVKVWIYRGEVLPARKNAKGGK